MSAHPTDIVVDTLYDDALLQHVSWRRDAEVVCAPDDPEEPYYTPKDGYLIVRVQPGADVDVIVGELQRQMRTMLRIVGVYERRPEQED